MQRALLILIALLLSSVAERVVAQPLPAQAQAPKRPCPLEDKDRFLKRYDVLAEGFRSYRDNVAWTAGLLVVSIGWFLNSSSSRNFIRTSMAACVSAIIVLILIAILHMTTCCSYYNHSNTSADNIKRDYDDLTDVPYEDYRIKPCMFWVNVGLTGALLLVLVVLIVAARKTEPETS